MDNYDSRFIMIRGGCPDIGNHNGKTLRAGVPELTLGQVMLPVRNLGEAIPFRVGTPEDRVVKKTTFRSMVSLLMILVISRATCGSGRVTW